jgi:dGTPase
MDRADEMSYAIHDLEDFYRIGMLPVNQLRPVIENGSVVSLPDSLRYFMKYIANKGDNKGRELVGADLYELAINIDYFPGDEFPKSCRQTLDRLNAVLAEWPKKRFVGGAVDVGRVANGRTRTINSIMADLQFSSEYVQHRDGSRTPYDGVTFGDNADFIVRLLTQMLWYYVIDSEAMTPIRLGQKKIIGTIFKELNDEAQEGWNVEQAKENDTAAFHMPSRLRDILRINSRQKVGFGSYGSTGLDGKHTIARSVVDYICTMTDSEAYIMYAKITGDSTFSKLVPMGG